MEKDHGISEDPQSLHKYYYHCPRSPDLSIIKDAWQYPKRYVKKKPHWDDELIRELALEAWADIPQDWINRLVNSISQRLEDVINSGGQLVESR